jgi:hypothetical protein
MTEPSISRIPYCPGFPGLEKEPQIVSYYLAYFNKRIVDIPVCPFLFTFVHQIGQKSQ